MSFFLGPIEIDIITSFTKVLNLDTIAFFNNSELSADGVGHRGKCEQEDNPKIHEKLPTSHFRAGRRLLLLRSWQFAGQKIQKISRIVCVRIQQLVIAKISFVAQFLCGKNCETTPLGEAKTALVPLTLTR